MLINSNTKIAAILKHNPQAIDAIIGISPKFEKLRNPLLRKLIAGRTSIAMAAKIGGCTVNDFFTGLQALGFDIDATAPVLAEDAGDKPAFMASLTPEQLVVLDVRPMLAQGNDPLQAILSQVKALPAGRILKIINTFEPTPLIAMLEKKGFTTYVDTMDSNLVETYFYKQQETAGNEQPVIKKADWDDMVQKFTGKLQTVDVRTLEMPLPMHTILEALDSLPEDKALYVYHKRIPVFLLPELTDRGFDYRIKEVSDGEVHLLIFKN
ncbi:DUF2249 domain-containing protein [Pedobacter sp. BS3]|uniref:DUF2249 domain-containing protein n=1 Tax=Pedobacter sp. BS3 TaxID=2567937 RepID=UPI0011EF1383|nr:DUF2249 domain-containing protein [Pedobacter sp. BS3]TZF84802.1 DUF2249 domain-containing protein [Pedobacter sp. BS3]